MRIVVALLTLAVSFVLFAPIEVAADKRKTRTNIESNEQKSSTTQEMESRRQTPKTDFGSVLGTGAKKSSKTSK